jgi:GNAT superfamily N-acetyltransferase
LQPPREDVLACHRLVIGADAAEQAVGGRGQLTGQPDRGAGVWWMIPVVDFSLVRCQRGDRWFPWNYGSRGGDRRVRMGRFEPGGGLTVINAVDAEGKILGSCALRVGARHSRAILGDDEYRYGALAAGPAYFWADNEDSCPWILLVRSFWVRPEYRRSGIARAFASYARELGLPAYLAFANANMQALFGAEFTPTGATSRFQDTFRLAATALAANFEPADDADFTVFVQARASAGLLWNSAHGGIQEPAELGEVLCRPNRIDAEDADSGEHHELGFADSAYAFDRQFGFALSNWCDSWGPSGGPFDELDLDEAEDDEYERAEARFALLPAFTAGSLEGWILDAEAMLAYAAIRRFLRTLEWTEFSDVGEAAAELFVVDLLEDRRDLQHFSALVTPIAAKDA